MEIYPLFCHGVPIQLLRALLFTSQFVTHRNLDFVEVFAGVEAICNGFRVFGYSSTAYDIIQNEVRFL